MPPLYNYLSKASVTKIKRAQGFVEALLADQPGRSLADKRIAAHHAVATSDRADAVDQHSA